MILLLAMKSSQRIKIREVSSKAIIRAEHQFKKGNSMCIDGMSLMIFKG